jgi:sugar lactone lactonase YvrE
MTAVSVIYEDVDHAECIAWDPAGRFVFGTEAGEICALDVEGRVRTTLATVEGLVLGIAIDGDAGVHACASASRSLIRWSAADGSVVVESRGPKGLPFRVPNYPAFHPDGSLYVSDSGTSWAARDGRIVRVAAEGYAMTVSAAVPAFPNGLAIDPEGAYLYALESSEPRLSRLPIAPEGLLGPPELVAELPRTVPDGVALATDGSVVVSCFKPDLILVVRDGAVETLAEDWRGLSLNSPTNVCFFGDRLERLAATNFGSRTIVEIQTALTGLPLHHPSTTRR